MMHMPHLRWLLVAGTLLLPAVSAAQPGIRNLSDQLDSLDVTTGWAAVNDDASAPAVDTTDHVEGAGALIFNKLNGTSNTVYALIAKTLAAADQFDLATFGPSPMVALRFTIPNYTTVTHMVVRLGTDASNYRQYSCSTSGNTAGAASICYIPLDTGDDNQTVGSPDFSLLDYVAVGTTHSAETDTLTGIVVDAIDVLSGWALATEQLQASAVHGGSTLPEAGLLGTAEAKSPDGALPNTVTEGQPVRLAATVGGVMLSTITDSVGQALGGAAANPFIVQISDGTETANVTAAGELETSPQTLAPDAATQTTLATLLTTTAHDAALGTAGTADAQVRSIQGIAGMTAVQVQSNAANLATETTAATLLTTAAHDAALGTAGTADTQVRSIQGIAGMTAVTVTATDLDIQSDGADLATSAQGSAIQTAVEIMDDWDETNRAAVNVISGQAGVSANIGNNAAATQRTVQAQTLIFRSIDIDETEEAIATGAAELCGLWITNTATATRWIKIYNASVATVVVGTTTPVITMGIPGNATDDIGANLGAENGCIDFGTAITIAATTGVADADTGAPGANEVIVNAFYRE